SRTSASPAAARSSRKGWPLRSSRWSTPAAPRSAWAPTAGPSTRWTTRSPPTSSSPSRSPRTARASSLPGTRAEDARAARWPLAPDDVRLLRLELGVGQRAARVELGELLQLGGGVASAGPAHLLNRDAADLDVGHRRRVADQLLRHRLAHLVLGDLEPGRLSRGARLGLHLRGGGQVLALGSVQGQVQSDHLAIVGGPRHGAHHLGGVHVRADLVTVP